MNTGRLLLCAMLTAALLLSAQACAGESQKETASKVARDWTSSSVSSVASEIGALVTRDYPILQGLAASVINSQIREKISWDYSEPVKVSERQYRVVATASSGISVNLLLVEKSYRVSAGFVLTVDTEGKQVTSWRIDIGSFSASEL